MGIFLFLFSLYADSLHSRMATTGTYFQTYLKRALDNLAIAERERETSVASTPHERAAPSGQSTQQLTSLCSRPLTQICFRSDREPSAIQHFESSFVEFVQSRSTSLS